jgi:hypothetical protein
MASRGWQDRIKNAIAALDIDGRGASSQSSAPQVPQTRPQTQFTLLSQRALALKPTKIAVSDVPSSPIPLLRLLTSKTLEAVVNLSDGRVLRSTHDLDKLLGNHRGRFDTNGENFTRSARNVRLIEYSLWAELKGMDGIWYNDGIGIAIAHPTANAQVPVKMVEYAAMHTPSLSYAKSRLASSDEESVHSPRIQGGFMFLADCRQPDGSYATSIIDLNDYIGMSNGQLVPGKKFSDHGRAERHYGTQFAVKLENGGWTQSIDLCRYVRCSGGKLVPYQETYPAGGLTSKYPTPGQIGALPSCEGVLLFNSVVVARCWTSQGTTQESLFFLDNIFGIASGRLRPFGANFSTDGSHLPKNLRLSGSKLSMEVPWFEFTPDKQNTLRDTTDTTYTVDLKDYILNNNGTLTL